MKRLRLLLIVLMSWVIPLNGFAATPASACPLQAQPDAPQMGASPMSADEMTAMSAAMPDCCLETDDDSSPAKPCKPGQACNVGWLFFALPASFSFPPAVGRIVPTHDASLLFHGQGAAIWHPPRPS